MFMIFFHKFQSQYNVLESLSFKLVQGSRVVHFTMLAHGVSKFQNHMHFPYQEDSYYLGPTTGPHVGMV